MFAPSRSALQFLAILAVVLVFLSCGDDDNVRPVYPWALAGPDSLAPGEPLVVQFSYMAGAGGRIESINWKAINDSVLTLQIEYAYANRSACGCGPCAKTGAPSGFPVVSTVTYRNPPARRFAVRTRDVLMWVEGGTAPTPENRLTVRLREHLFDPVSGAEIHAYGAWTTDNQTAPVTDATGNAVIYGECGASDHSFHVDAYADDTYYGRGEARWPKDCREPMQMVILAL